MGPPGPDDSREDDYVAPTRLRTSLIAAFGAIALRLAAMGIAAFACELASLLFSVSPRDLTATSAAVTTQGVTAEMADGWLPGARPASSRSACCGRSECYLKRLLTASQFTTFHHAAR